MSTGFENGVAIPHPRNPMPDVLGQSVVAFGRTLSGIPFGVPKRQLSDLFFLVLCRDPRTHLRVSGPTGPDDSSSRISRRIALCRNRAGRLSSDFAGGSIIGRRIAPLSPRHRLDYGWIERSSDQDCRRRLTPHTVAMAVETDPVHELQSAASSQMTDDSPRIGLPEGCPTPLGWAQVLDSFRSESTSWTLQHDGAVIEGRTLGRGRPVYFLNAIAGDSELFCLLAWLLRDDFRCVVFDYPTRDETSLRQRRQTAMALAADLLAIADSQGDEVFSLFATPFGSLVAVCAPYSNPDRVDRAVFLGGFAHRRLSLAERLLIRAGRHLHGTLAGIPLREQIERAESRSRIPSVRYGPAGFLSRQRRPDADSRSGGSRRDCRIHRFQAAA